MTIQMMTKMEPIDREKKRIFSVSLWDEKVKDVF